MLLSLDSLQYMSCKMRSVENEDYKRVEIYFHRLLHAVKDEQRSHIRVIICYKVCQERFSN